MERRPTTGVDVTEDGVDPSPTRPGSSPDAVVTTATLDVPDDSVIDTPMPDGASLTAEAVRLLDERYARGEITREEFLERRAVLDGTARDAMQ